MEQPLRILVVDDERDTLDLIDLTLRTAGYQIHLANSGTECLEMLRRESYDVVLLDIMMPDMTGYEVHETLKGEMENLPPIIYLTAKAMPEDREEALRAGANGFLAKPFTMQDLKDTLYEYLPIISSNST